jgi:hypothetical protein
MPTPSVETENRRRSDPTPAITTTCTGSCSYSWQDGEYVYVSGSCSGRGGCPTQCPGTIDSDIAALLFDVSSASTTLSVSCASIASVAQLTSQSTSLTTYRRVSIALGTVLALSLIANVYLLFFR